MKLGFDKSQLDGAVDWDLAYSRGIRWCTLRVSWGINSVDTDYAVDRPLAAGSGVLHKPYHWYVPKNDPLKQAANFLKHVVGALLAPMLDLEDSARSGVYAYKGIAKAELLPWLRVVEDETGIRPDIYANLDYITKYLQGETELREYKLIVANYRTAAPFIPQPWNPSDVVGWQHWDEADAPYYGFTKSLGCALQVWYDELPVKNWTYQAPEPEPDPDPDPAPIPPPTPAGWWYGRVRRDDTNGRHFDPPRTGLPEVMPCTVEIRTDLKGTAWEAYQRALLGNDQQLYDYACGSHLAMYNGHGSGDNELKLENLWMAGNAVMYKQDPDYPDEVRLWPLDFQNGNNPPIGTSWWDDPTAVQVMTLSGKEGSARLSPKAGGKVFYPVVCKAEPNMLADWIEPFPMLPRAVKVKTWYGLNVRSGPAIAATRVRVLSQDSLAVVTEYVLRGPDVWGKIGEGEYIALQFNGQELTDWHMATTPPPLYLPYS